MLRALILKAARVARALWSQISVSLTMAATASFSIAATAATVLSTEEGYTLAAQVVKTVVKTCWNAITRTARFLGRMLRRAADAAVVVVGHVSATAVDVAYRTVCTTAQKVEDTFNRVDQAVRDFGSRVWQVAHDTLVRKVATTGAGLAAAFTALRNLTEGTLDQWLIRHLPSALRARLLGQWSVLLIVAAATSIVILIGVIRGWFRRRKTAKAAPASPPKATPGPQQPQKPKKDKKSETPQSAAQEHTVTVEDELVGLDWELLATMVTVDISPDGSVMVHGIPDWVPAHLLEDVAHVAADAAITQVRRTLKLRREPTRDDKRLYTKVAREALRRKARPAQGKAA